MKIELIVDDRIVEAFRALKRIVSKRRIGPLTFLGMCGAAAIAHAATKPHTFEDGDMLSASAMNENFDEVYSAVTALEAGVTNLQDTVGGLEQAAQMPRDGSLTILGSTVMARDAAVSLHGYFYLGNLSDPDDDGYVSQGYGEAAINLPLGTELKQMTCYFYNDSDLAQTDPSGVTRRFRGSLRRVDLNSTTPVDSVGVATIDAWPEKSQEIQAFSAPITESIQPDTGYLLHLTIEPNEATVAEVSPAERYLRHYGCKIDYRLP